MKTAKKAQATKSLLSRISHALIFNLLAMILLTTNIARAEGNHEHEHHPKKIVTEKSHHHSGHHDHGQHKNPVGKPAKANEADKTIHVDMLDSMTYVFDKKLHIHRNEVIRFTVTNKGKITHEFSIGNAEEQRQHAEMMRKMPDMKHKDGNTLSLQPGESGEITWKFQGDTAIVFACNIAGHFEAGMFTKINVKTHH